MNFIVPNVCKWPVRDDDERPLDSSWGIEHMIVAESGPVIVLVHLVNFNSAHDPPSILKDRSLDALGG